MSPSACVCHRFRRTLCAGAGPSDQQHRPLSAARPAVDPQVHSRRTLRINLSTNVFNEPRVSSLRSCLTSVSVHVLRRPSPSTPDASSEFPSIAISPFFLCHFLFASTVSQTSCVTFAWPPSTFCPQASAITPSTAVRHPNSTLFFLSSVGINLLFAYSRVALQLKPVPPQSTALLPPEAPFDQALREDIRTRPDRPGASGGHALRRPWRRHPGAVLLETLAVSSQKK